MRWVLWSAIPTSLPTPQGEWGGIESHGGGTVLRQGLTLCTPDALVSSLVPTGEAVPPLLAWGLRTCSSSWGTDKAQRRTHTAASSVLGYWWGSGTPLWAFPLCERAAGVHGALPGDG